MFLRNVTMVLGIAATLAVSACGQSSQQQAQVPYQQQPQQVAQQTGQAPVYNTVQDCQNDPNNPNPNLCAQSFAQSQQALPHYASVSSCQAQGYSDCHDYGGWFGPAFAGFMLGSYLNGGYHPYPIYVGAGGYLYGNGYSLGYRPVRSYYGGYYHYGAPAHTVVVIHSTPTSVYRTAAPASAYRTVVAPAPTVQRGGFGGTTMAASRPVSASPYTFRSPAPAAPSRSFSMGGSSSGSSSVSRGGFSGGGGFHSSGGSRSGRH
jgi:uncharacterized protein YgiB involved in biofilm formation